MPWSVVLFDGIDQQLLRTFVIVHLEQQSLSVAIFNEMMKCQENFNG
jgi:hypothetical protein